MPSVTGRTGLHLSKILADVEEDRACRAVAGDDLQTIGFAPVARYQGLLSGLSARVVGLQPRVLRSDSFLLVACVDHDRRLTGASIASPKGNGRSIWARRL